MVPTMKHRLKQKKRNQMAATGVWLNAYENQK
jgi:hypothetical protein